MLLPLGLFAAASVTPTGATIETNGWVLELYWTNLTIPSNTYTNAAGMNLGFDTNHINAPTNANIVVTITAPGFSTAGVSNNSSWKAYGTWPIRQAYPNFTNIDATTVSSTNCWFKVAMSDYVGPTATASITVNSGLISNNVSGTFTATNNSTQKYPKVIGNWAMPDFQLINSSTFTVKAVIPGEPYGRNGQPVACVIFTATDQHSHSVSVTNAACAWDRTMPDAIPIPEYTSTIDASTMTDKDNITINFKAYPWVGTSTEVLDTSTTGWGSGTPFPHDQTYVLNKSGGFSKAQAKLSLSGNDSTGVITTNGTLPTAAFLTPGGVLAALEGTNNTTSGGSNNTPAGASVWVASGNYSWTSGPDDAYRSWVYFLNHPTNSTPPAFTNGPGSGRSGTLLCFSNITMAFPSSVNFPFFNYKGYWCLNSTITNHSTSMFDKGIMYYTGCNVLANDQGFTEAEASQQPVHIMRGNTLSHFKDTPWDMFVAIGNSHSTTNQYSGTMLTTDLSGELYEPDYSILAFNRLGNVNSASGSTWNWYGGANVCTNGARIIQNIFEQTDAAGPSVGITPDSATGPCTNIFVAYNTCRGFWNNLFYNDSGTALVPKLLCIEKGNIYQGRHAKSDTFAGTANSNRLGNWSAMWSVANSGNADLQTTNIPAAGGFLHETRAPFDFQPDLKQDGLNPRSSIQNLTNYARFTLDGGYNGSTGPGNGNYRLLSTSPLAQGWEQEWLLPIDIEGKPRGRWDPPGAHTDGNVRHGGAF